MHFRSLVIFKTVLDRDTVTAVHKQECILLYNNSNCNVFCVYVKFIC